MSVAVKFDWKLLQSHYSLPPKTVIPDLVVVMVAAWLHPISSSPVSQSIIASQIIDPLMQTPSLQRNSLINEHLFRSSAVTNTSYKSCAHPMQTALGELVVTSQCSSSEASSH